jgi:hypothetical protein
MPQWITGLPEATAVAWWGAVLSTLLTVTKIWEIWQERFRVEISGTFVSDSNIGNKVRIRNLATKPVIITHWEVFYGSGIWPFRKEDSICDGDWDADDFTIKPSSTFTLSFADESYFSTNVVSMTGRSLYIRVHVAGRKTILRKLYPF